MSNINGFPFTVPVFQHAGLALLVLWLARQDGRLDYDELARVIVAFHNNAAEAQA